MSDDDVNCLVRELDVLWNGASGAAKQASLCDMLSQITKELPALRGTIMDLRVKLEAANNRNTAMMKMGDRLIAERAQSEYICTCGIRVTPHKCPTNNGF